MPRAIGWRLAASRHAGRASVSGASLGYVRFLLAAMVVFGHTGWRTQLIGGPAAVEAFFLISGFYMGAAYTGHYERSGPRGFLLSRCARLYPTYLYALALASAAWLFWPYRTALNVTGSFTYFAHPHDAVVHVATWTLLFQDVLSISETWHLALPVRQAWSISAELVFYALVPMLVAMRRALAPIVLLALAAKLVLFTQWGMRAAYFPFFGQFFYFALGMLLYFHRDALRTPAPLATIMAFAFALLCFGLGRADLETGNVLSHVALMALLAAMLPGLFERGETRASQFFGDISYGVYLIHLLLFDLLISLGGSSLQPTTQSQHLLRGASLLALASALAAGFELTVQRRVNRWRRAAWKSA